MTRRRSRSCEALFYALIRVIHLLYLLDPLEVFVESLNDNELEVVQTFIDFMHYNRREGTGKERGCNHEI